MSSSSCPNPPLLRFFALLIRTRTHLSAHLCREWRQNQDLGIFKFASFKKRNFCSLGFTISSFFDFSEDFKKIANFGHFRRIFGSYSVNETFFEAPACHYLQLTTQDNISWLPENVQKDHFWLNLSIFIKNHRRHRMCHDSF